MRRLVDIPIFNLANRNNAVVKKMLSIPVMTDRIEPSELEDAVAIINRRFSYNMKIKTMKNYEDQNVVPVFNKNITLSPFIPVFLMMQNNRAVSVCNMTNVATRNKKGDLSFDNRVLYTMLQTGTILKEYAENFDNMKMNDALCSTGADIYARLMSKILDAKFAVTLSPQKNDIVNFLISKFFLIYQMERANDQTTNNLAYKSTSGRTSLTFLIDFENEKFNENIYNDGVLKFVDALSKLEGMSKLNGRLLLKLWVQMYGESTMLALEYLPYFYHMVLASLIGGNINKQFMIEAVAAQPIAELDKILAKTIR